YHTCCLVMSVSGFYPHVSEIVRGKLTLTTKDNWDVPELGHVEGFKDLALVGSTITIECKGSVWSAHVTHGETDTSANRNLSTDNTVSSKEALCKHVHGATLSVGNSVTLAQELTNDGLDGAASHVGKAVAAVGGDDVVFWGDGML